MQKEKYLQLTAAEGPQEEKKITVTIPESIYHLYNAVYEQPATGSSPSFLEQAGWSVTVGNANYPMPESCTDQGAPRGKAIPGHMADSLYYPGVAHDYLVYVPSALADYAKDCGFDTEAYEKDGGEAVPLAVVLDGQHHLFDRKTGEKAEYPDLCFMFDNLIAAGKIPPTILLIAAYGEPGPGQPINGFTEGVVNRSFEYDRLGSWFSDFLLKEMMPAALSGFPVSADPAKNVICGMSTAGTGAFQTAWYHPDVFGSVVMAFPGFVNIRGGHILPSVVRVEDRRPVRIFQVTGKYDLNNYFGNWHIGSLDMGLALHYKEYDHRLYVTESGHDFGAYHLTLQEGLCWALCGTETAAHGFAPVTFDPKGMFRIEESY